MSAPLGLNAKTYRNSGTYGTPVWVECDFLQDITLNLSTSEADATTRANAGWAATVGTLQAASVDFKAIHDTANADYLVFWNAYWSRAPLDLVIADGPIETEGTRGLRASFQVLTLDREDTLEGLQMASGSLKPTWAANPPTEWVTGEA